MDPDHAQREQRVALIVVHGVADQQAGTTAKSVVDLLVASKQVGVRYAALGTEQVTLHVDPLPPACPSPPRIEQDVSSDARKRPLPKALRQSARSDFQREDWRTPHDLSGVMKPAAPPTPGPSDRGLAATDYLLAKHRDNGAPCEAYETLRIDLQRSLDAPSDRAAPATPAGRVHVYEMYWADLSRLSGALPRVFTELFSILFRLSKLGRDTVQEAARRARSASGALPFAWTMLTWTQTALDWALANLLGIFFAMLAMFAIVIVAMGWGASHARTIGIVLACAVPTGAFLYVAYPRARLVLAAAVMALVVAGVVLSTYALPMLGGLRDAFAPLLRWIDQPITWFWIVGVSAVTLAGFAYDAVLRVADKRFPAIRGVGLTWGVVGLVALACGLWLATARFDVTLAAWVQAALLGVEVFLWLVKFWWVGAALTLAAWLIFGRLVDRKGGYTTTGSVATGRLGLFTSLGAFLLCTLTGWAALTVVFRLSVGEITYAPRIFPVDESAALSRNAASSLTGALGTPFVAFPATAPANASASPSACARKPLASGGAASATADGVPTAACFLEDRFEKSTEFFALIAALLILLVFYMAVMFVPSILYELQVVRSAKNTKRPDAGRLGSERLGKWLTYFYRRLDAAVRWIVYASVVAVIGVGLVFLDALPWADAIRPALAEASAYALRPFVIAAAGVAAALTLLGGVLSRYASWLRAPLDVALDVDNHFRDFPRSAIPRARIFSRYAALLRHVARQGYDRVVIVAHSQGTVITAELLRDLARDPGGVDPARRQAIADWWPRLAGKLHLLTVGCPLRQLYAARFPALYRWVLESHDGVNGPRAEAIGVERWFNAYTSGDYVGRWLWSSPAAKRDPLGHPLTDSVHWLHPHRLGRRDAYARFDPLPPAGDFMGGRREAEMCLGAGAHTHYFETDQADVAWLIDTLITAPPVRHGERTSSLLGLLFRPQRAA